MFETHFNRKGLPKRGALFVAKDARRGRRVVKVIRAYPNDGPRWGSVVVENVETGARSSLSLYYFPKRYRPHEGSAVSPADVAAKFEGR